MTTETLDLARRAVACDGWRWLYGCPATATFAGEDVQLICMGHDNGRTADFYCLDHVEMWDCLHVDEQRGVDLRPDFDEPAATGCLLHLVREAWGDLSMNAIYADPKEHGLSGPPSWVVCNDIGDRFSEELPTEAAALVEALEAGSNQ